MCRLVGLGARRRRRRRSSSVGAPLRSRRRRSMSIALQELVAVGDRGDDLVAGRGADGGDRGVVGRLGERDDELVVLEVDRRARGAGARARPATHRRRVLVERRLEEVDEAAAPICSASAAVRSLLADETEAEQHRRQRLAGAVAPRRARARGRRARARGGRRASRRSVGPDWRASTDPPRAARASTVVSACTAVTLKHPSDDRARR